MLFAFSSQFKLRALMWLEEKLTNCGKPIKNIVFLAPINVTINPHKKFPIIAPIDTIAPIHDICSVESGPDVNGLWSDWSSGVAIDTHPVAHPKPTIIKLASICNKIRETFFVLENSKLFQCSQLRMKFHTHKQFTCNRCKILPICSRFCCHSFCHFSPVYFSSTCLLCKKLNE